MAIQTALSEDGELTSEINTTPLIDVMLVLLVMLIVTLPPMHHGVTIDTPSLNASNDLPPTPVHIGIDFDGSYYWNGRPIDADSLDARLAAEARREEQPEIHVEPHRLTEYHYVVHVMAVAQREGLTRIGVAGGS